jgi:membrane protease YdiL (CAAX protease family)
MGGIQVTNIKKETLETVHVCIELTLIFSMIFLMKNNILYSNRVLVACIGILYILAVSYFSGYSLKNIGMRMDNIISTFQSYAMLSIAIITFEVIIFFTIIHLTDATVYIDDGTLHMIAGGKSNTLELTAKYFLFEKLLKYGLIFCFFQELLFRGYLTLRLKRIFNSDIVVMLAISFIFALAHIIMNNWIVVFSVFLPGMLWTWFYLKKPNLLNVTLSHFICGIFGVLLFRLVYKLNILDIIMSKGFSL